MAAISGEADSIISRYIGIINLKTKKLYLITKKLIQSTPPTIFTQPINSLCCHCHLSLLPHLICLLLKASLCCRDSWLSLPRKQFLSLMPLPAQVPFLLPPFLQVQYGVLLTPCDYHADSALTSAQNLHEVNRPQNVEEIVLHLSGLHEQQTSDFELQHRVHPCCLC